MKVRAKLTVESVSPIDEHNPQQQIVLRALYNCNDTPEDNSFSKWTPSADARLNVTNPEIFGFFEPGKSYYVDFSPTT